MSRGRLNVKSDGARSRKEMKNWLRLLMCAASMSTWRDACSMRSRAVKIPVPTANWDINLARIYRYILTGNLTSFRIFLAPLFLYHTQCYRQIDIMALSETASHTYRRMIS